MHTRRDFMKAGAFAATSAIASPFVVTAARAQTVNLKMQGFLPAATAPQKAFEAFAATLKEKSKGALAIQVLPAGGAVGATETINAVNAGILDGHYSSSSYFASKDPGFTVFGDTGSSYDNVDTRNRWYEEGGGNTLGNELYGMFGMVYISNIFWPSEHLPSRKALKGVADLKGLKIRVPPGMISETFGLAGAAVVNLPGGEVFNSLQSGVIDATDWASPSQNMAVGLYRAAKFSINASHSMPSTEIAMSKRSWAKIPAELQKMIVEEAHAMSESLKSVLKKEDDDAVMQMKSDGVEVITWAKPEVAKLRTFTSQVQDKLAAKSAIAKKIVASHRDFQKKVG